MPPVKQLPVELDFRIFTGNYKTNYFHMAQVLMEHHVHKNNPILKIMILGPISMSFP